MTRKYWSDKEINFIKNNLANMTISEMARHFNVSYDKMADKISDALSDTNTMRNLIDQQRLLAGDVSVDQYKEVIEGLKGE